MSLQSDCRSCNVTDVHNEIERRTLPLRESTLRTSCKTRKTSQHKITREPRVQNIAPFLNIETIAIKTCRCLPRAVLKKNHFQKNSSGKTIDPPLAIQKTIESYKILKKKNAKKTPEMFICLSHKETHFDEKL